MKISPFLFKSVGSAILHAITHSEEAGGPGDEKKKSALKLIRFALEGYEALSGKHVLDIPEAEKAISDAIDAVVHAINAVKKAKEGE